MSCRGQARGELISLHTHLKMVANIRNSDLHSDWGVRSLNLVHKKIWACCYVRSFCRCWQFLCMLLPAKDAITGNVPLREDSGLAADTPIRKVLDPNTYCLMLSIGPLQPSLERVKLSSMPLQYRKCRAQNLRSMSIKD
jgi:hypothetical protein